jgi:pimeloyl-ACP methyl ester carboxylesterase
MNPMFMEETEAAGAKAKKRRFRFQWGWILRGAKFVGRIFFTNIFRPNRARLRVEDGTPVQRFIRGLLYRLAFVPVVLVLFVIALVFAVTHPPHLPPETDPLVQGVYYDPVNFLSEDGTRLEGWLVPVYDAKRVLEDKERTLHKKYPAIVLVHDYLGTRQQMMPLIPQLHDAGLVILVVGLRGTGSSSGAGQTFGLKESMDVRAAVDLLRRRSYVDPAKVSVMGLGTGANAAILAAQQDPNIAGLIVDRPVDGFDTAMMGRLGQDQQWLGVLMPLFKWTFEAMYHVDADELQVVSTFTSVASSRPTLRFASTGTCEPYQPENADGIAHFLRHHKIAGTAVVASAKD